jgi:hypothetical protein
MLGEGGTGSNCLLGKHNGVLFGVIKMFWNQWVTVMQHNEFYPFFFFLKNCQNVALQGAKTSQ